MQRTIRFSGEVVADGIRDEGSLILALIVGILAAIIGTMLWVWMVPFIGENGLYLPIGMALLVGIPIRLVGNSSLVIYGLIAAGLTLLGGAAGEVLTNVLRSIRPDVNFYMAVLHMNLPQVLINVAAETSLIKAAIDAVALIGAYWIARRKVAKV